MKRDAAQTIFRTVVFAGAMLGTGACAKKAATAPPAQPAVETSPVEAPTPTEDEASGGATQASEDPDQGGEVNEERPRGTDVDGGGGRGRGFVLS